MENEKHTHIKKTERILLKMKERLKELRDQEQRLIEEATKAIKNPETEKEAIMEILNRTGRYDGYQIAITIIEAEEELPF